MFLRRGARDSSHIDGDFRAAARDRHSAPDDAPDQPAVNRRSASWYFSEVLARTSGGSSGAGCFLFHGWVSSQLRTICLSNEGGLMPVRYSAAGQNREESGVSTSS